MTCKVTFAPRFVILSINVEGLFYAAYCTTLVLWDRKASNTIESTNVKGDSNAPTDAKRDGVRKYNPRFDDVRIALFFFFFFVQGTFFGTGK